MKNLDEANQIAKRQRLTNVRYLALLESDDEETVEIATDDAKADDAVVVAVVGDREGAKNVVYSTSTKTTSPIDHVSSFFEEEE